MQNGHLPPLFRGNCIYLQKESKNDILYTISHSTKSCDYLRVSPLFLVHNLYARQQIKQVTKTQPSSRGPCPQMAVLTRGEQLSYTHSAAPYGS